MDEQLVGTLNCDHLLMVVFHDPDDLDVEVFAWLHDEIMAEHEFDTRSDQ